MKAYYREKIRLLAEFGIPITEWITIAIALLLIGWINKRKEKAK